MAVVFFDGFDDIIAYSQLASERGWANHGDLFGGNPQLFSLPVGRYGSGKAVETVHYSTVNGGYEKTFTAAAHVIFGVAIKSDFYTGGGGLNRNFIEFRNGAANLVLQIERRTTSGTSTGVDEPTFVNTDWYFRVFKGTKTVGNLLFTNPTRVFAEASPWLYVEVLLNCNVGSEQVILRVNGAEIFNATGITLPQLTVDRVRLCAGNFRNTYDDVYLVNNADGTGFLGNVRIPYLSPDADTAQKDFTPNAGGTNYTQVDETSSDSDTTYVSATTPGARDILSVANVSGYTPTGIKGVTTYTTAKVAADPANLRPVIRTAGVVANGASVPLTTSYSIIANVYTVNPATGVNWTPAEISALEAGYEIT